MGPLRGNRTPAQGAGVAGGLRNGVRGARSRARVRHRGSELSVQQSGHRCLIDGTPRWEWHSDDFEFRPDSLAREIHERVGGDADHLRRFLDCRKANREAIDLLANRLSAAERVNLTAGDLEALAVRADRMFLETIVYCVSRDREHWSEGDTDEIMERICNLSPELEFLQSRGWLDEIDKDSVTCAESLTIARSASAIPRPAHWHGPWHAGPWEALLRATTTAVDPPGVAEEKRRLVQQQFGSHSPDSRLELDDVVGHQRALLVELFGDDVVGPESSAHSAVNLDEDPWEAGWAGPELVPQAELFNTDDRLTPGYTCRPEALMFEPGLGVPLALEHLDAENLTHEQRDLIDEEILQAEHCWVLRSTDDPRAWIALSATTVRSDRPDAWWNPGPDLRSGRACLSPWLADDRLETAVSGYFSECAPLARAVACVLTAFVVTSPYSKGITEVLGPYRTLHTSDKGIFSPLENVRRKAITHSVDPRVAEPLLADDLWPSVREQLASCGSDATRRYLAADSNAAVRRAVVDSIHFQNMDRSTLIALALTLDAEGRLTLLEKSGDRIAAEILSDDPAARVATAARALLGGNESLVDGQLSSDQRCLHEPASRLPCVNRATTTYRFADSNDDLPLCIDHAPPAFMGQVVIRCESCGKNPATEVARQTGEQLCKKCAHIIEKHEGASTDPITASHLQQMRRLQDDDSPI